MPLEFGGSPLIAVNTLGASSGDWTIQPWVALRDMPGIPETSIQTLSNDTLVVRKINCSNCTDQGASGDSFDSFTERFSKDFWG